ncbi:2-amino-4-hydroxy-6-hydroxymethyldihydropteridinepyrophosphokinase [Moraxella caviae]|nr:2-amino-4-hydroxy-6-hydroxymethyldihydropteridinepyrophosphokinase [Moraxella caviae]VEW12964.1 2-amino-4-hydroxy-6-hydroxymethyldihydropteridinepyrophosphokinase [Moraxella caviae]
MADWVQIYLGLGGNIANELGDPKSHILAAANALAQHENFRQVRLSSLYSSKPFGVTDQPDFVNAVLAAQTNLAPLALLDFCQSLEQNAGRVRLRHWGERSLDVDILLYGNQTIDSERLVVPHAFMWQRNFVLVPLFELDEHLIVDDLALKDVSLAKDMTGLIKLPNTAD